MSDGRHTKDVLSSLASTIVDKAPYFGSFLLPTDAFKIFFDDKNGQGHSLNTATATNEQLSALAEACSVAPFGRGAEAVVDDTYRKAGKLDLPYFAVPFEPETTALVPGIRESVLEGAASKRPIRFELYKLNVYSEGGFFKAHKDTPRGAAMFGSLVLIYPTTHSGGALAFRHQDREWTFDSAAAIIQDGTPTLGYAAFYSDVEHEVLPVTSGYRVTITYNLYFDDIDGEPHLAPTSTSSDSAFQTRLTSLLEDPSFLPKGGYLGFGLRHSYPIELTDRFYPKEKSVQHLQDVMKGADASVLRAARTAGLSTQLHIAYDTYKQDQTTDWKAEDVTILTTEVVSGGMTDLEFWYYLTHNRGGVMLYPEGHKNYQAERAVHWVTPVKGGSRFKSVLLAYGNEPSLEYHYSELCLLVAVGPYGERAAKENLSKIKSESDSDSSYDDEEDYDEESEEVEGEGEDQYDDDVGEEDDESH